ncbi:hypothetical protein Ddye_016229 [Dipteronia dyeriana]|uniref:Uncharacterized protein n=1 Tax=Dipteronia dyeriana TaxID=168575 RepID=A0AAD9U6D3_9ROSI|nr:hypothetical protein Ddye_016229 [Dipteronia dyeriana]
MNSNPGDDYLDIYHGIRPPEDPDTFYELQNELAEIQEQIHIGHRLCGRNRESPVTERITSTTILNSLKFPLPEWLHSKQKKAKAYGAPELGKPNEI